MSSVHAKRLLYQAFSEEGEDELKIKSNLVCGVGYNNRVLGFFVGFFKIYSEKGKKKPNQQKKNEALIYKAA